MSSGRVINFEMKNEVVTKKKKPVKPQKRREEIYDIRCHMEGCQKLYKWRVRYGKQRLLEHVFTDHLDGNAMTCGYNGCDAQYKTIRQVRVHYRKTHPKAKIPKFDILKMFNLALSDEESRLSDLFIESFGPHFNVIGRCGTLRNTRMKRDEVAEVTYHPKQVKENYVTGPLIYHDYTLRPKKSRFRFV
ncbi:hypothetical protein CAEBREN_00571 [Caenorhabditis brenneri]|uniref:C2H2-type domain-containing protein n=1 Tax=Caenorhabditis brenneri TaxID=135651 RepID=G0MJ16_CAEBE|nr:hypothetical protein CAEBREN_00571 [Caenorhabditis brenneri]